METKPQKHKGGAMRVIRNVYMYLVTFVGLVTFIFGAVGIINNVLQHFVFQVDQDAYYSQPIYPGMKGQCAQSYIDPADPEGKRMIAPTTQEVEECKVAEKELNKRISNSNFGRELSISLAQILIGLPIWLYHWGVIQKEYRRKEDEHEEETKA
ncbi:hypothetical protein IT413_02515 [Candidatus Peregrinibacteria bacterium]|nr:hypothetical protein [Candidatus Peregrinibacteria bacterium]